MDGQIKGVRLDYDTIAFVESFDSSRAFSKGIKNCIDLVNLLLSEAEESLRGIFTINEWKYMADVLNINKPTDRNKYKKTEIYNKLFATRIMATFSGKHGIKAIDLQVKFNNLRLVQVIAILRRVENFYASFEGYPYDELMDRLDKWADF